MDGIGEGDEQVTIVRFAIEEILEKAIDPHPHTRACVRARVNVCIRIEITCSCGNRERCLVRSLPWRTVLLVGTVLFETTLRIDIRYQ